MWAPRAPIRISDEPWALRTGLRQLAILRTLAISGQAAAIGAAAILGVALPLLPMLLIVAGLVVWNVAMFLRLRAARDATTLEVTANLAIDLAAISTLLYLSGGTDNPFVLLLVLHAVMMALLLPPVWAALGAVGVVVVYVAEMHVHLPLAMRGGEPLPSGPVALGNTLSFVLTIGVTAWFVVSTVAALRRHERSLEEATRRALRDDAVLRVGAVAAGAAHELATPLTTITVASGEILRHSDDPAIARDARIIAAQASVCRETVATLVAAGSHAHALGGQRVRCDAFVHEIAERCRTLRPEATIASDWRGLLPAPEIVAGQPLHQALQALVNNAVDASPRDASIVAQRVGEALRISVADRGGGLELDELERLGRAFFTTKAPGQGAGLGVVLATRAIEQLGGRLRWENRSGGGVVAEVEVPLAALAEGSPT